MASEQIIIEYIVQVEGMKAQLKTVQQELKNVENTAKDSANKSAESFAKAGESIKDIGKEIALSLGIAFSVGKVLEFAKESVKAFNEAQEVAKKLEFAITKIGNEGVAAFEKLTKQADRLSKITIFSDEDIKKSQTQLAQFGLTSKEIEKLIPRILDLASATGQDLTSATQLSIAGINGQGRALKPYGIVLEDTGDKVKNLSNLTEGLSKFTGSSAEAFNSATGQQKFFDNQINELQESIGSRLSPVIQNLEILTLKYFDVLLKFTQSDILKEIITGIGGAFSAPVILISDAIDKFTEGTKTVEDAQKESNDAKRAFLAEETQDIKDNEKQKERLTAKGIADKEAALKKSAENQIKIDKEINDALKKSDENEVKRKQAVYDLEQKVLQQKADDEKKYRDDKFKAEQEMHDAEIQNEADFFAKGQKFLEKQKQDRIDADQLYKDAILQTIDAIVEYKRAQDDYSLSLLKQNLDQGIISQTTYDSQVKEIKRKAAVRDKALAAFNITLATSEAVIKALAIPPPAGEILAGVIAALGAVQLGLVIAKPVPLAKGIIDIQGGVKGQDSIASMLMPGESVMTTEETQRHGDLLRSIRSKNLDTYLLDNYINPKLSAIIGNSTAEKMAKSASLNGLDEYALARVMSRNKGVNVQNADYLAESIARELNKGNVKRMWGE